MGIRTVFHFYKLQFSNCIVKSCQIFTTLRQGKGWSLLDPLSDLGLCVYCNQVCSAEFGKPLKQSISFYVIQCLSQSLFDHKERHLSTIICLLKDFFFFLFCLRRSFGLFCGVSKAAATAGATGNNGLVVAFWISPTTKLWTRKK